MHATDPLRVPGASSDDISRHLATRPVAFQGRGSIQVTIASVPISTCGH
jgi:hypothetical protein